MTQHTARILPVTAPPPDSSRLVRPGVVDVVGSTGSVYTVTIGRRLSCDCKAGSYGRGCRHQRVAVEGWPALWTPPARFQHLPSNVVRFPVPVQPEPTPPAVSRRQAQVSDLYGPEVA